MLFISYVEARILLSSIDNLEHVRVYYETLRVSFGEIILVWLWVT